MEKYKVKLTTLNQKNKVSQQRKKKLVGSIVFLWVMARLKVWVGRGRFSEFNLGLSSQKVGDLCPREWGSLRVHDGVIVWEELFTRADISKRDKDDTSYRPGEQKHNILIIQYSIQDSRSFIYPWGKLHIFNSISIETITLLFDNYVKCPQLI